MLCFTDLKSEGENVKMRVRVKRPRVQWISFFYTIFLGEELALMTSPASESNNNAEEDGMGPGQKEVVVTEISPLVSYAGEGLGKLVGGKQVVTPYYLSASS